MSTGDRRVVSKRLPIERGRIREGLESSIAVAGLAKLDDAAVELARFLADKLDAWDTIVRWALDDVEGEKYQRPKVPANDNVTPSAYLKSLQSLGLTPEARGVLGVGEDSNGYVGNPVATPFDPEAA